jgi:hypothetical protein
LAQPIGGVVEQPLGVDEDREFQDSAIRLGKPYQGSQTSPVCGERRGHAAFSILALGTSVKLPQLGTHEAHIEVERAGIDPMREPDRLSQRVVLHAVGPEELAMCSEGHEQAQ